MPTSGWRRRTLYIGGLMGPFGTGVILPMFPELRDSFSVTSGQVGWGFTVYFLPFAALLVVSGTIGERLGRGRVVRITFLAYAAASLLCAFAPNFAVFLVGRGLQGTANAFITPLLLAGLADLTDPARLGRTVGIYSSFQALGQGAAPLLGGLAADVDWRWAFVGTAVVAATLSFSPPEGGPRRDVEAPPVRPLFSRRMVLFGLAGLAAAAGPIGVAVLVGVAARDELGLSGSAAGLLLLTGSVAAFVLGPVWGRMLDTLGGRRTGLLAALGVAATTALLALASSSVALGAVWAVVGGLSGFVVVVLQSLGAAEVPDNRGGALSSILAYRFLGHALGPVIWLPVFSSSPDAAFLGSAALGLLAALAIAASGSRTV